MTQEPYPNDDDARRVGPDLGADLRRLIGTPGPLPEAADARVMAHYRRSHARRRSFRWVRYAAAALVLLTVGLYMVQDSASLKPSTPVASAPMDIDRDGKVDILDALRLAQRLPNPQRLSSQWDFNRDGLIDRRDVDLVAYRAVRLPDQEIL